MTLIPNLLISGILTMLVSLVFFAWSVWFVEKKYSGLLLIGLSVILLLVGGGFGPPLLGIILGAAATRIGGPLTWWRTHLPEGLGRALATIWPWSFSAALVAWLFLFPGSIILDQLVGGSALEGVVYADMLAAFGSLLLTLVAGFAYDLAQASTPTGEVGFRTR